MGDSLQSNREKSIMVDGKTYRRIKQQERDRQPAADETAAAVLVILEEEFVDMFGE